MKSTLDLAQDRAFKEILGIKEEVTIEKIREWRKRNPCPVSDDDITNFRSMGLKVLSQEETESLIELAYAPQAS